MHRLTTLILIMALFACCGCSAFLFHPSRQLVQNPVHDRFPHRDCHFIAKDGTGLHGWFFPAAGEPKGTVLVMHGNAENLSTHVNTVLWLVPAGFNLFIFDYRGFGRSEGKPALSAVHLDGEAALDFVLALPEVKGKGLAVLGQSIGGAIAVQTLAASPHRSEVALLALDSTPSSYRLIAREKLAGFFLTWPFQYPLSWLFSDNCSPIRHIGSLSPLPLLIMHGSQDPVVPEHHGKLLFAAAAEPKEYWQTFTAGHVMSFAEDSVRRRFAEALEKSFYRLSSKSPG